MTRRAERPTGRAHRAAAALIVALAAASLAACDSDDGGSKPKRAARSPAAAGRAAAPRSFLGRLVPPPRGVLPAARVPGQIRRLVARLPVERKVAQLMLVGFSGTDQTASFFGTLKRMDLGGVVLGTRNYTSSDALPALTQAIANAAAGKTHEPPFVLAPQEGGDFSAFPDLPPGAPPGKLNAPADAAVAARATVRALRRAGVNGVLGPDVDVGASGTDPLGPRAFSDRPHQVSRYAAAVVSVFRRARMLTAPSHFPGIGAATSSTDEGPTSVGLDMRALERRDVPPFRAAIEAGTPAVMVGHAGYAPDSFVVPASLSRTIETNLLRGGLGFRGIAITDDLDAGAIVAGNSVAKAAVQAVTAGADMVWISSPRDWPGAYRALLAAVRARRIPLVRLNAAVTRIVTAKRELGLRHLTKPKPIAPPPITPAPVTPAPAPGQ